MLKNHAGKLLQFASQIKVIIIFYCLYTFVVSILKYNVGVPQNYIIFKFGWYKLLHNSDQLYNLLPNQGNNLFKYSPAFAMVIAPFYYIPNWLGSMAFNLGWACLFLWSIVNLTIDSFKKAFILWFVLIEFTTSIQNFQLNVLILALMVLSLGFIEKDKPLLSTLFLALSVFIKLYSIGLAVIFLFYPKKLKAVLYSLMWGLLLAIVPICIVSYEELLFLYKDWFRVLKTDVDISAGLSFISILYNWFHVTLHKSYIQLIGLIAVLIPLIRHRSNFYNLLANRMIYAAFISIFIIIFNHKAESSTYIIAVFGVGLWYTHLSEKTIPDRILLILVLIVTCLNPTDLFPREIRVQYFEKYNIKPSACILVWFKIFYDLMSRQNKNNQNEEPA